jgi:hypothetical protein
VYLASNLDLLRRRTLARQFGGLLKYLKSGGACPFLAGINMTSQLSM